MAFSQLGWVWGIFIDPVKGRGVRWAVARVGRPVFGGARTAPRGFRGPAGGGVQKPNKTRGFRFRGSPRPLIVDYYPGGAPLRGCTSRFEVCHRGFPGFSGVDPGNPGNNSPPCRNSRQIPRRVRVSGVFGVRVCVQIVRDHRRQAGLDIRHG